MIRCGTDIIEVERIKDGIENIGDKFLNRIYTEKEIEYCNSKKVQKYQSFAGRFAAKEAIFKALTDVIENKYKIEWKDFEIVNNKEGKPIVIINNEDDFGQIIEQIEFLDQHDDAYLAKLQEHWLIRENEKDYWSDLLMNFFDNIFTQPKENAKRYPRFGYAKNLFKQEERCSYVKQNLLWNKFWGGIDRIRKMRYHE